MAESSPNQETADSPIFVVLGATGGIGSSLSRRLAASGAGLMLASRSEDSLQALAGEVGAEHAVVNATSFEQVESCIAATKDRFGRFNGIACCVGSILLKPAHRTSRVEFDDVIATNLSSAFATVRAAARELDPGGSIVLVGTAAAGVGLANHEAIAAAKAGVTGLARSAAATYASRGIRVNVVAPGLVDTPLSARITSNEASLEASKKMHPLGRIGQPEDIASAIAWLLAPENSWVTGQVLAVDGGLGHVRPR